MPHVLVLCDAARLTAIGDATVGCVTTSGGLAADWSFVRDEERGERYMNRRGNERCGLRDDRWWPKTPTWFAAAS